MKPYRIEGGRAHIPAGTVIGLSLHQYRPRGAILAMTGNDDGRFVGSLTAESMFKSGEIVWLDDEPPSTGWGKLLTATTPKKAEEAAAALVQPAPEAHPKAVKSAR